MPRVTHVKKAQQRYATKPVIDPATGQQKRTPVMKSVRDWETGEVTQVQKTSKRGPVFLRVTERDLEKPLPLLSCDFGGCTIDGGKIAVGSAYKHITPKSGPWGGQQRNRHAEHPNWNVWEYSYSRSAQVARTQHDMHETLDSYEFTSPDDFDALRDDLAQMAQEAQDEAQEALDNMPESLQDGSQAQENAETLESWVSEVESASAPDHDETCQECEGTGKVEEVECEECGGTGEVEGVTDEWAEEAKDVLREAIDSCEI